MRVVLGFKNIALGKLGFDGKSYSYTSSQEGEKKLKQYISSGFYHLDNSLSIKSVHLFKEYAEILENIKKRADLISLAGITDADSDFEILCKFGRLSQDRNSFHIKTID